MAESLAEVTRLVSGLLSVSTWNLRPYRQVQVQTDKCLKGCLARRCPIELASSMITSLTVGSPVGGGAWQSVPIHSPLCNGTQQNREMSEVQKNSSGDVEAIIEGKRFYQGQKTHPRQRQRDQGRAIRCKRTCTLVPSTSIQTRPGSSVQFGTFQGFF